MQIELFAKLETFKGEEMLTVRYEDFPQMIFKISPPPAVRTIPGGGVLYTKKELLFPSP